MKLQYLSIFCLLFLGIACTKDALKIDANLIDKPFDKNINLSNIQWGQESRYILPERERINN